MAAAFVDEAARATLMRRLHADHFQQREHKELWTAFQEANQKRLSFDLAVIEQLATPELRNYLAELVDIRPDAPRNLDYHLQNVLWDHARVCASRGPVPAFIEALRDPKTDPSRMIELARVIAHSFEGHASSTGFELIDAGKMLGEPNVRLPRSIWQHFRIAPGRPTILAGYGGHGKTAIAQVLGLSIAAGLPTLWGTALGATGIVRHLDYECGRSLLEARTKRLAKGLGIDGAALKGRYEIAFLPRQQLDADAEAQLLAVAQGASLVIIDSLAAAITTKRGENDTEIRKPLDVMNRVSNETGCVFLVIAHEGKGGNGKAAIERVRGSSAITDAGGGALSVTRRKDGTLEIEQTKASNGSSGSPLRLRFVDEGRHVEEFENTESLRLDAVGPQSEDSDDNEVDRSVEAAAIARTKESMLALLRERGPLGATELRRLARGRNDSKKAAIAELVDSGAVLKVPGPRSTKILQLNGGS